MSNVPYNILHCHYFVPIRSRRLFELDPGAKDLFGRVNVADFNSPEFSGHIMRVMGGLDILMNYMHNLPALESMLAHLATQHSVRPGVTTAGFDVSILMNLHCI